MNPNVGFQLPAGLVRKLGNYARNPRTYRDPTPAPTMHWAPNPDGNGGQWEYDRPPVVGWDHYPVVGWGWDDIKHAVDPRTHLRAAYNVIKNPLNPLAQTRAVRDIFVAPKKSAPASPAAPPGYGGYDPSMYAAAAPAYTAPPPAGGWGAQLPGYDTRAGMGMRAAPPPPQYMPAPQQFPAPTPMPSSAPQYDWGAAAQYATPQYDWGAMPQTAPDYGEQPTGWAAAYGTPY